MTAEACSVCRRGEAPVCERCRTRMRTQLADLPGLWERLQVALVPMGGGGERVRSVRGEAPMPVRLAALSLVAGGSDDARCCFVPAVRVWTTTEVVIPYRPVVRWHRELVRDERGALVMALADDQAGVLPIQAWERAWARAWRQTFGPVAAPPPVRTATAAPPPARLTAAALGIGAALPYPDRPADPVAQEWEHRWPPAGWGPDPQRHHAYLTGWLRRACDEHPHVGDFATSLRTLTGAVRAALGDADDLEYLGRCPDELTDRTTGVTAVCGAALWHDPYASVVTCPRCHTETGQDRRIWLARRILDVWPIDRRRRYPRGLIDILRQPACATCGRPVEVTWIDATERADRERFWRPGAVECPAGCVQVLAP